VVSHLEANNSTMGSGSSSVRQNDIIKGSEMELHPSLSEATLARKSHMSKEAAVLEEQEIATRSIPLFENVEQKSAILIASILKLEIIRSGQTIAVKGSQFDSVLVLKSGALIISDVRDGFETTIGEITKPFSIFGEDSFQNATPLQSTLKAKTACTLWKLERREFENLFKVSLQSFLESQRRRYKPMTVQLTQLDTMHSRLPFKYKDKLDPLTRRVMLVDPYAAKTDPSQFPKVHADVRWDRRASILETMKLGCPVDCVDEKNNSLLIVAVQNGHLELARMFLELGADINLQNDVGATALHYSIEYDYPRITALLRANGASEIILDAYGAIPAVGFTNRNSQSLSRHLPKHPIAKPQQHQPKSDFVKTFMMSNKMV
jgi:CRP-like cAMP-binding protein